MKSRISFLFLLLSLIVATSVATTQPSSAIETGFAAFGDGQFQFFNDLIRFSFEAHGNEKRHARGRAVFDNLTTQTQVVVKIDCLRVIGSDALITGTVLHSDDPDFPKSTDVVFDAFDGRGNSPDTMTPLFANPPFQDCNDPNASPPLTFFQVDDIVVQP